MIRNCSLLDEKTDLVVAFPGGKGTVHMVPGSGCNEGRAGDRDGEGFAGTKKMNDRGTSPKCLCHGRSPHLPIGICRRPGTKADQASQSEFLWLDVGL
jgi:hypothetical protein